MEPIKKKRGRPRKNVKIVKPKSNERKEKKEENIVLFLALSDSEKSTENTEGDNKFTVTETKNNMVESITNSEDSESNSYSSNDEYGKQHISVQTLINEIKKRDAIIASLRNKSQNSLNSLTATKNYNINYQCTLVADSESGKKFIPKKTEDECWWCDHGFDNYPAYIPNYYKNNTYYIFGNFCSFNCALRYNNDVLKDFKCQTRRALIQSLKTKTTNDPTPIKIAPCREILKTKACTIENFRNGFTVPSYDIQMNMPPMIPLVHVLEEGNRD